MEGRPSPSLTKHSLLSPEWHSLRGISSAYKSLDFILDFPSGRDGWTAFILHSTDTPSDFLFVEKPESPSEPGRVIKVTVEGSVFVPQVHEAIADEELDSGEVSEETAGEYTDFQDAVGMNQLNDEDLVRLQELSDSLVRYVLKRENS